MRRVRRALRRRATDIFGNAFELWIAVAAVLTSATYFLDPALLREAAVGEQAGAFAFAWSAMYGAGGLVVLYGVVRPSQRGELAGLCLLAGAALVNSIAIYVFRGPSGLGSALTYGSFAAAAVMRGFLVWQVWRLTTGWPKGDRRSERRPLA